MTLFCENEAIPRDKNKLLTYLKLSINFIIPRGRRGIFRVGRKTRWQALNKNNFFYRRLVKVCVQKISSINA